MVFLAVVFLWWCGVFVVVFFCGGVFCGGVFVVVVFFCGGVFVVWLCFCGGVVVWLCFCCDTFLICAHVDRFLCVFSCS